MAASSEKTDTGFMRLALREARKGLGKTSPNPAVGAVIVKHGRVIAKGFHRKAGLPHAEIEALSELGGRAPGCTLYVTLEPCNHFGKTPPCTEAILKSGIRRVVVGMFDPNPEVSGGGCAFLEKKGIEVTAGVLEQECRRVNEVFLKFVLEKCPFVIAKSAVTLDGWTGTSTGHSKWITNEKSRQFVHRLRGRVDAVMVGVGTVLSDDPQLTTRIRGRHGRDPLRIVLDTHLRTPAEARVVRHQSSARTLIAVAAGVPSEAFRKYDPEKVSFISCPLKKGRIDLSALMGILGEKFVTSVLVEGGATVMGSLLRDRLIDKYYIFQAPKILGGDDGIPMAAGEGPKGMDESVRLKDIRIRRFADDILVVGYPEWGVWNG